MQSVTYIYHEVVREVHKKCMKLQTSSRSNPNEIDIILLRIKINSSKVPEVAAEIQSAKNVLRTNQRRHNMYQAK